MDEPNLRGNDGEILDILENDNNLSVYSDSASNHSNHITDSEECGTDHESPSSVFGGDDSDLDPDFIPTSGENANTPSPRLNIDNEGNRGSGHLRTRRGVNHEGGRGPRRGRGRGQDRVPDTFNDDGVNIIVKEGGESTNYYYGKDRFKWAKAAPSSSRIRATNIVTKLPGIIGNAKDKKPLIAVDAWKILVSDDILNQIVDHTNQKISQMAVAYGKNALDCQFTDHTDIVELEAFIGLLYLAGVFKSNHEDVESLFATDGTGRDIFRSTMTAKRFLFLLGAMRFDDAETRIERLKTDALAPISEIFNVFIDNCKSNYSCGEYLTVDEMLVGFRGRCKFRMYMKSKPAKYGIKILCLCDAKTHYLLNAFVYTGKDCTPNPDNLLVPTATVLHLTECVHGSNRNITGDNWFTSVELVDKLAEKNLTYVGTIRSNKREIPPAFKPTTTRPVNSSAFGFTRDKTLVSYVPKKNRSVTLLSTMHHDSTINEDNNKKPEIIEFYNMTKSGVDALDQKSANYSVNRRTRRWPQVVWFAIMNIAGVNAHIFRNAADPNKKEERMPFIISLGKDLILGHLKRRALTKTLPRELRELVCKYAGVAFEEAPQPERPQKRKRCGLCSNNDNKYSNACSKCYITICKTHSKTTVTCVKCYK